MFMKRFLKFSELLFFAIVNLFFSVEMLFLTYVFSLLCKNGENFDKNIIIYLFCMFLIWIVFLLFKVFTFPFLYWLRTLFPNIHKLLFKIKTVKKFRNKYLLYVLSLDTSIFIVILCANNFDFRIFFPYLLSAGGILPCYLIFIVLLKLFKPISYLYKIKK